MLISKKNTISNKELQHQNMNTANYNIKKEMFSFKTNNKANNLKK